MLSIQRQPYARVQKTEETDVRISHPTTEIPHPTAGQFVQFIQHITAHRFHVEETLAIER